TDAIVRTLVRLFITRQRLLEWVAAAQSKVQVRSDLAGWYRWMAGGSGLALAAAAIVARAAPGSWQVAAPFLILWFLSPALARWASLPLHLPGARPLSDADIRA